jgi:tetratricopeptide (TPR) repeat protein
MKSYHELDERLIRPILRAADLDLEEPSLGNHPDEEMIALFAEGNLSGTDRDTLIGHLSDCSTCREVVRLLSVEGVVTEPRRVATPRRILAWSVWTPLAIAASVLLLVGGFWLVRVRPHIQTAEQRTYAQASERLRAGDFDKARTVIDQASARGIHSGRLRALEAQAVRQMPAEIALAYAGRLTDFGYGIGGVVARNPAGNVADSLNNLAKGLTNHTDRVKQAYDLFAEAGSDDLAVLLNRGHVLLTLGRPEEALDQFRLAVAKNPSQPLAWLGQGLSLFALDRYPEAGSAFRECLRLDPGNIGARMNLAMTLEEQGKGSSALGEWKKLLSAPLSETDRTVILNEIEQLRKSMEPASKPK